MPTPQSERAVSAQYDESADIRRQRMARLPMVPGAIVIRISQQDPSQTWPSPYARAYDEHGRRMEINRVQGLIAARWIIRSYPGVRWDEAHDLDLTTGVLKPAAQAYAAAGGVR